MKYLRGPVVALFAFLIGVAVSPIHFEEEGRGIGRMLDGKGGFSVTSYYSSYFVKLSFAHAVHASPEKANAVFDETLVEAIEVIEHAPILDEHGKSVGRRGLGIFVDRETDTKFASVFWTQGSLLHAISSTSVLHVLEFEKQNVIH